MLETSGLALRRHEQKPISLSRDIKLGRGEKLLILGESGCGKTTILHMLAGLLRPSAGKIIFNGQDYAALSDSAMDAFRGKNIGFIFQKIHLIGHLTARQNIGVSFLGAREKMDRARIDALLENLYVADKGDEKASALSHGQAQRIAIGRALVHRPPLILADEPTSALDDKNAQNVMDILCAHVKHHQAALVVSTHDRRIAPYFDTVMEIKA